MIINRLNTQTDDKRPGSIFAFLAVCCFVFSAFCLSLILLVGCEQSGINASAGSSQLGSSQQAVAEQELSEIGFVVEDISVVQVEIGEE